jgi:hypothetical protein
MNDLFETPELLPEPVQAILTQFSEHECTYLACLELEVALKPLGYRFTWGLSAEPFYLRKI